MSDIDHDEDHHSGPIKTPAQVLGTALFSIVVPIFAIIGLVYFVTNGAKPAGSTDTAALALGGVSTEAAAQSTMARIQKVGMVEIRDANRELKTGEQVFKAQCTTCHLTGLAGSPKFGDAAAWGPRIKQGLEALLHSAMAGKGAMGAQAGGDFDDLEIARAVVYMANAGGAKFIEPAKPAAAAAPAASAAVAAK